MRLDGDVLVHKYELFNEMAAAFAELQIGLRDRMTPKDILEIIMEAEPVDPVIRCKDCKHRDVEIGFCKGRGWPEQLVPDYGFCDRGERSEK